MFVKGGRSHRYTIRRGSVLVCYSKSQSSPVNMALPLLCLETRYVCCVAGTGYCLQEPNHLYLLVSIIASNKLLHMDLTIAPKRQYGGGDVQDDGIRDDHAFSPT